MPSKIPTIRRSQHLQLVQQLRRQFLTQYHEGDRLPTIQILARQYHVSEPTLRSALLALAQEGVIELHHGRGSFLKPRAHHQHIAVVMDLDFALPSFSYYWRRVAQQLRRQFRADGWPVRLYFGERDPNLTYSKFSCGEFLDAIAADQVCGVALLYGLPTPEWTAPLHARGVPVVGSNPPFFEYNVCPNTRDWLRLATRRLLDAGRCRIALLRWAQTNQSVEADPDLAVFRAVLAERGASFQPGWVRGDIHPNRPGSGWAEFREIWTARTERPDALIVADEVLMQSAVPAILATGTNVPQELQIVTHATRGSDTVYPFPVWALEVDPDEVAQQMGTMLLQRLRGQTPPQPTVLVSARWADSNTVPHPAEEAPV